MNASSSLCQHRSEPVISYRSSVISHDQRALDATLRDGWKYLIGTCRKLPEPDWEQLIKPRLTLIRADFKQKTRGKQS